MLRKGLFLLMLLTCLLHPFLLMHYLLINKRSPNSKGGINQPVNKAAFCLSLSSPTEPAATFRFAKRQILQGNKTSYWRTSWWGARRNAPHVWNFLPFWMCPRDAKATCAACLWAGGTIRSYQHQQAAAAPAQEALLFCPVHAVASFHSARLSSLILFFVSSL